VGIIGANGAGKTTFVNMITGYQKPDAGRIHYQGRDITPLAPRQITRLGICRSFQVPQVFVSATVEDNLLIALGVAEYPRVPFWRPLRTAGLLAGVDAFLERYRLAPYRTQPAASLPQGVRKLLDIAMALVHKPRLLLLDEPTSGVSVDEKFGIMDIVMGALRDAGVTVLFVEHDMEIVGRYAQRVLAFYEGRILADGAPAEVLGHDRVKEHVIGRSVAARRGGVAMASPEHGGAGAAGPRGGGNAGSTAGPVPSPAASSSPAAKAAKAQPQRKRKRGGPRA
jgi:branched-chain amino acid transport system ATP-binding protein